MPKSSAPSRQASRPTSYRFDPSTREALRRLAGSMRLKDVQALRQLIWTEYDRRGLGAEESGA